MSSAKTSFWSSTGLESQRWWRPERTFLPVRRCLHSPEAEALLALMKEFDVEAWLSFTLRDGGHLSDGTPLAQAAKLFSAEPLVAAIGVNCVPLELVSPSLEALGRATDTPLIAYPNSGESYDAVTKTWGPAAATLQAP